ncbi:uncharacterized protein [Watersipora subatra]|uniref:uncharacterized protein n=1 Tax=Watersipora subatra TaxID=2589382 RepID=UPI00355B697F
MLAAQHLVAAITHAAATFWRFAALLETDRHKTKELIKLKEESKESKQQIVALQEAGNRKTAALANQREESQRQIVTLQEANNQMTADMAAMMERLNRLDIYLRTPTDTDETGDQLHEPQS